MKTSSVTGIGRLLILMIGLILTIPVLSFAQQLRIVEDASVPIDPTVYRAYYGKLAGEPHLFTFTVTNDTPVKILLLVPDVPDAKTDISATLVDTQNLEGVFVAADGGLVEWQRFFDTAGRDSYLAGPSIDTTVPPGEYRIQVSSAADDAPYVLVVSGESSFSPFEIIRRYATVPNIKSEFFGKNAAEAYLTPLLLWPMFAVLIVAALIVFIAIVSMRRASFGRTQ